MAPITNTIWNCLILSVALLVLLLLPIAKPSYVPYGTPPWTYCGATDFYNPSTDQDFPMWVATFYESYNVQPVTYNVTLEARQLIPNGRVRITLAGVTTKHKLCALTHCPIQPGLFTFSFNRIFQGLQEDGKFIILSKNKTITYTCVIFHGGSFSPDTPAAPEPVSACPINATHTCVPPN